MGLVRTQKIGEGMHIQGKGKTIDITIVDIRGCEFHRKARFKIEGVAGLSELELSADQRYFSLTNEIKIEIGNGRDLRGGFVCVNYHAPKSYSLKRKEYHDSKKTEAKKILNINHPVGFYYKT